LEKCARRSRKSTGAIECQTNIKQSLGVKMNRKLILETTLGDLVYALTEEVRRHIRDEKLAYEIVADLLAGLTSARGKINYSGIPSQLARLAW